MSIQKLSNCTSRPPFLFFIYVSTRYNRTTSDTIKQDKAAVLVYLRMKHKNPVQGYVLCGIVSTTPLFDLQIRDLPHAFFPVNPSPGQHQNRVTYNARKKRGY